MVRLTSPWRPQVAQAIDEAEVDTLARSLLSPCLVTLVIVLLDLQ